MQRILNGDVQRLQEELFRDQDELLSRTRSRLIRVALARGITSDMIDDVMQETFLEAWTHLDRLYAPEGFALWIDEICRNVCRRATRRLAVDLRRSASLLEPSSALGSDIDETKANQLASHYADDTLDLFAALDRQDLVLLLDRALGMLPSAMRQLVEMCYVLELSHAEVAARLDISNGALETRLHRARRHLRQILSGPLRYEAEAFGLVRDGVLGEGWHETRIWCPLCRCHRLQGCFIHFDAEQKSPNLHMRCPNCFQHYGQDTVHSMGLVSLTGLHTFRPAWKRTMQGLADCLVQALSQGFYPCLSCEHLAQVKVQGSDGEAMLSPGPYPFWIHLHCVYCGKDVDASGNIPSVDQLVSWSHPLTRQFLQQHPRCGSTQGRLIEYGGEPAIHFQISNPESTDCLSVVAHRQTLHILTLF